MSRLAFYWQFSFLAVLMAAPLPGAAAPPSVRTKTIGELLKNIENKGKESKIKKEKSNLPLFNEFSGVKTGNLQAIRPPVSSKLYYEEGSNEAELEKVTDQLINQAFRLTRQFKNSKRRGELWLRLAELYVEKSRLIEFRIQTEFDESLRKFQAKEIKRRPKLDLSASQEYNKKAIELYEWFLRDFPQDQKVDQALFFLGYNYFELSNETKGKSYYEQLIKQFPESPYVDESNFALGEFNFENERWREGLNYYRKVATNKRSRLYSFALYKMSWCQYKLGGVKEALKSLESVIRVGRIAKGLKDDTAGGVSRIRLATEAMKDLVVFYAEAGTPDGARAYFDRVVGEKNSFGLTEKLAYYYADTGNRDGAKLLFKEMISVRPNSPKAYDYQYQVVSIYAASGNNQVFKEELYEWITTYGPESPWATANINNKALIEKATQLIETTLRNFILQQHQSAQNSRAEYSQKLAKSGYEIYFNTFKESPKLDEMHFFFAELLYDIGDYERASYHYSWVGEYSKQSKYFDRSLLNAVLSQEKVLPAVEAIRKQVGETSEPVEFDKTILAFEKAAMRYLRAVPNGDNIPAIKYRLGSLYYYYNQFDKALPYFDEMITKHPGSPYAEFAANLTLDIYNIRKDFDGLEKAGQKILSIPELARSPVGAQVKDILQRASFKRAQNFEGAKDYLKSAEAYEDFAKKNRDSELAHSAHYNAAVNYERAGQLLKALSMYAVVLSSEDSKASALKKNAAKYAAGLYEKTGQYSRAADAFEAYARQNEKDKEAVSYYFNSAVIRDGLNQYAAALSSYQKYLDLSRNKERNEVLFLMGKIWERRNNNKLAVTFYEKYYSSNPANSTSLLESTFLIGRYFETAENWKQATLWYQRTVAIQRRVSSKDNPVGASWAAEAKFHLVYRLFDDLRAIRIPANSQQQGKAVQLKLGVLNRLKDELAKVIKYDDGFQIVASLALIGQAYQHMAASLYNAPLPKGLDPETLGKYKAGVEQIARPFQAEAVKSYQSAIERGRQLEGYNSWMKVAYRELSVLSPSEYYDTGEKATLTRVTDSMGL